jgi:hypothetical protein
MVDRREPGVGGLHLAGDALLFGLEQVGGDGVVVVGLDELAALVVELGSQVALVAAFVGMAFDLVRWRALRLSGWAPAWSP